MRSYTLTGNQLKAARREKGINQTDFGRSIGVSRHTVSYWETKATIAVGRFFGTPRKICEALGLPIFRQSNARARPWGFIDHQQLAMEALIEKQLADLKAREAKREAKRRVICGAKTRKGHPCRLMSEPGRRRCKFHGGKSTGPRTQDGKNRIAEAQRRRWAKQRVCLV